MLYTDSPCRFIGASFGAIGANFDATGARFFEVNDTILSKIRFFPEQVTINLIRSPLNSLPGLL